MNRAPDTNNSSVSLDCCLCIIVSGSPSRRLFVMPLRGCIKFDICITIAMDGPAAWNTTTRRSEWPDERSADIPSVPLVNSSLPFTHSLYADGMGGMSSAHTLLRSAL
ncbi:hypothetical protein D3C84_1132990 [compost metagenome]